MLKLTKPPYADTEVDAEKTQQQITQLLRKYGVSQVNWNVNYDLEQVQIDFILDTILPQLSLHLINSL